MVVVRLLEAGLVRVGVGVGLLGVVVLVFMLDVLVLVGGVDVGVGDVIVTVLVDVGFHVLMLFGGAHWCSLGCGSWVDLVACTGSAVSGEPGGRW